MKTAVLTVGQIAEQVNEDRDRLEQAARVLLLLQRPRDDAEQRNLWHLFECRLRQAYAGAPARTRAVIYQTKSGRNEQAVAADEPTANDVLGGVTPCRDTADES